MQLFLFATIFNCVLCINYTCQDYEKINDEEKLKCVVRDAKYDGKDVFKILLNATIIEDLTISSADKEDDYIDPEYLVTKVHNPSRNIFQVEFENCFFKRVPRRFFNFFSNIEIFNITNVGLQHLDVLSFYNGTNLKEIYMSQNKLKMIVNFLFIPNPELEVLDFSYNQIEKINPMAFEGLEQIQKIDVSHNKISSIDSRVFRHLKSLQSINLSHNKLRSLSPYNFISKKGNFVSDLKILNLDFNNLKKISPLTLTNLKKLHELTLEKNECVSHNFKNFHEENQMEILKICYENYDDLKILKNEIK